jgi:hypothetical protein
VASSTPASSPCRPACAAATTPGTGVGEQDRQAVGREHDQPQPRGGRHEGVDAGDRAVGPARAGPVDDGHAGAVDLLGEDEGVVVETGGAGDELPVGADRCGSSSTCSPRFSAAYGAALVPPGGT